MAWGLRGWQVHGMTQDGLMPIREFPVDPDQVVGKFWAATTQPSESSDGVCSVHAGTIEVEVARPLTPSMVPLGTGPGLVPAREEGPWTLHGSLPISPGAVTLLGVRTAHRLHSFPSSQGGPELHRLRADWCLAGAHVDGLHARYNGVRARFTHLELWARASGLKLQVQVKPEHSFKYTYASPEAIEVPFEEFGQNASLTLRTSAQLGSPDEWGVQIMTNNLLELDGIEGWTLEEIQARFVIPVKVLLTLLAGAKCEATHLEVQVEDRWCPVYGAPIAASAPRPSKKDLLLDRAGLGLDVLASWCGLATRLSPGPHVVASATEGAFVTVQSEALALTTAAEGLDRVLYPGSRRFTEDQVADAVACLEGSSVATPVREALSDALSTYLYEDSYPTRVRRLADAVAQAAPGCVGRANRWARAIVDMRVGLAHALGSEGETPDDALLAMYARTRSLRWALLLRILLEAGVPAGHLATALSSSRRYEFDERQWRELMPDVFNQPREAPEPHASGSGVLG